MVDMNENGVRKNDGAAAVYRHSAYKDYVSHVVDPRSDPITRGLGDYVVTDELYHPHVFDPARITKRAAPSFCTTACCPYGDSP